MKKALTLAKRAYSKDEVPVGALIVKDGKIVASAYNLREHKKDATAHAEILAIKKACKKIKDFRLTGCDMYVTLEPCLMCMGAILNARIENLYFGASANKQGAIGCEELVARAELNHKTNIIGGICKEECSKLVSDYFKHKRNSKVV